MGFALTSGYTPLSFAAIMDELMAGVNTQFGTTYTTETFIGSNHYKNCYKIAQYLQQNDVKTSEIFVYLQQYFAVTNERISRPVVTNPGLVEIFAANDFIASVKKPIDADAGKVFVCVETDDTADDYDEVKLAIATIIKDSTVAGVVSQGTESEAIVLTNGQSFDFKFNLPDRQRTYLRLTITLSENNQVVIGTPEDVKQALLTNIAERYSLGKNFEPQKYFGLIDAPWAAEVLLEYSDDGIAWETEIYDADYDHLKECDLEDVTLVEV